jgi:predicted enzyme related to lactoylglutathione lyase
MISRIEKVTVYVSSQEAAKRFWVEKIGFVVALEQSMGPGMTWLEVGPKGEGLTTLVLYPKQAMMQQNPGMVAHPSVIFASPDIEKFHARITAAGVEADAVQSQPYGKMFSFRDQDGNRYMVRG